jgi:methylated-DNA-[protein]-cysteine S-methyltransferase
MSTTSQTTFDTALGPVTLSYTPQAVRSMKLHEQTHRAPTNAEKAGDVPDWVREVILRVKAHLEGTLQDFSQVPLNFDGLAPFYREVYEASRKIPSGKTVTYGEVYEASRKIPSGKTVTYGELAKTLGRPAAARAVGQALSKNPIILIVPCHRIVGSTGNAVGFSAPGGVQTKARMLALEGARVPSIHRCDVNPAQIDFLD